MRFIKKKKVLFTTGTFFLLLCFFIQPMFAKAVDMTVAPYNDDQTINLWNDPNVDTQPTGSSYVEVSSWDQFHAAVMSSTVSYIKLMADIQNPSTTEAVTLMQTVPENKPATVIDGNNFQLDTRCFSYLMTGATARGWYLKNLKMFGASPYGCFNTDVYENKYIVYDNITFEGSQLTAAYKATLVFRGSNQIISANNTYTTTINGTSRTTRNDGIAGNVASGLEGHRAIFQENSNTTFTTGVGDGLILGAYLSNTMSNAPYFYVENNTTVNLNSIGDGGESYGYNATGGRIVNAGANVQNGGSFFVGSNSQVNIDVSKSHRAGMRLTGGSSTRKTKVSIAENGKLNISTGERLGMQWASGGQGQSNVTDATYPYYSGLTMDDFSELDLTSAGSELTINMTNSRYSRSTSLGYPQGIRMASNSSVLIGEEAKLNLNMDGSFGSALKMTGSGASFTVKDKGAVSFITKNQTGTAYSGAVASPTSTPDVTAVSNIIQVDSGTFTIGKLGIFDMLIADGTGTRNMFYASSGSFTFSDAYRVDLNAQGNNNVELINMNGTFSADIQAVHAWNKGTITTDAANYDWIPIYNAKIGYSRSSLGTISTTSVSTSSINQTTIDSFVSNYRTENFNRILYEWIPDVEVSLDEVSDNVSQTNGKQISGITNPNAYVLISVNGAVLGTSIDTGSVNVAGSKVYYNVQADASGKFSLTIPSSTILYVGDVVTAYSFLNGKENTTTTTVLDETPPEVTTKTYYAYIGDTAPAASAFVSAVTDKGVTDTSGYPISYASSTDINTLMQTAGTKEVTLNVSDLAVDSAGVSAPNTSTATANLIVYDDATNISGDSLELSYVDIRNMTDSELSNYILSKCNPVAFNISNGVKTTWDDSSKFQVSNLGDLSGLTGITPNKDYPVTIMLPKSVTGLDTDLTTNINVKIINMNSTLTIQFEDEAGTVLDGYTLTAGEATTNSISTPVYVGDTIDLTSATFKKVQDQLTSLQTAGYELVTRPTNETALPITDVTQTVTYTVKGLLFLKSAPSAVDFGSLTYNAKTQRVDNPTTTGDLVITDTRATKTNGWTLYAAVTTEMKNSSTGSIMSDALRYVTTAGNEVTLSSSNQAVYTNTTGGTTDITSSWGTTSDTAGLKLVADPNKTTVSSVGTYSGVITWTIMAGQP